MPSPYLTAGSIISWVPRPNKNAPDSFNFNDDTWIECNGIEKCKSGRFAGQYCSDLSDRVLVGAGKLGQILDMKDASLPDHAHSHAHDGLTTGVHNYKVRYRIELHRTRFKRSAKGTSNIDNLCWVAQDREQVLFNCSPKTRSEWPKLVSQNGRILNHSL